MTVLRRILTEGTEYEVVISDERETLLAAKAAGRVAVGLADGAQSGTWLPVSYLLEAADEIEDAQLERIVRRHLGLPWTIAESDTVLIREFCLSDLPSIVREPQDQEADRIFYERGTLNAYIESQYGFYEYGMWAVIRKSDGALLGKAGVTAGERPDTLELGYHIFSKYRRQGYALRACRLILKTVDQTLKIPVLAKSDRDNQASLALLKRLGFTLKEQRYTEAGQCLLLYERSCR